ncbi:hypothetical protein PC128_g22816 [Phytophthora cactorum]|nr:hypothetical protein PC120_g15028 [Phytophthora cactorum]KAG3045748.1 hypothetical protein PC121_g21073 [Phytophthora cactorum]KAG3152292.1 hypothetical protein PC128_g22816 [Phytophthora cactorum]KAG4040798.1 hypothetical protein PC123_g23667 [Phytophthora cactorum]
MIECSATKNERALVATAPPGLRDRTPTVTAYASTVIDHATPPQFAEGLARLPSEDGNCANFAFKSNSKREHPYRSFKS